MIGVGGIGGVLATNWLKRGVTTLTLVTPNERIRKAWTDGRVTLNGTPLGQTLPEAQILERIEAATEPFDLAFLAVQPDQIEPTLAALAPRLTQAAEVVTLTNGLCDEKVSSVVGPERAVGAVVMWGARMPSSGEYIRTSRGGFVVGKLNSAKTPISNEALELLSWIGPTRVTPNLLGARFSKLALNAAISTLGTIGGETLGSLLLRVGCRNLTLGIVREAVTVAHAQGIRLESVTPLDMEWLGDESAQDPLGKLVRHLSLLFVGFRYRRLRSSMLAAVERGREPAVDYLNGEIARRGDAVQIPTPLNEAARKLVWEIAYGREKPGRQALDSLTARGPS